MKALALLIVLSGPVEAAGFKLSWIVATMTPRGPQIGPVPEATKFKNQAECEQFGNTMTPRMQDWIRGRVNADWDHSVAVKFTCELEGQGT